MATAIAVEGLRKAYGAVDAVKGVSFDVAEGEVFALLGPNGAGKTTVVEILEGHREPTAGAVSVLGVDPARAGRDWRARIGIVLQEQGVLTNLTPTELLRLFGAYYPRRRPPEEVLELAGLTDQAGTLARTLSGGQQRRLDLALALVGDPDLLFLDEPTTGFDPSARRRAWDVVKTLCSLGKTVLLTTHYMDEAAYLADRLAVIVDGRLVAEGTPHAITERSTHATRIRFAFGGEAELPVPAEVQDGFAVIDTPDPTPVLHALTGWALEKGIALAGLTVTRPSLEDVYLELTRP